MDRTDPEHAFDYEVGFRVDKKKLGEIIDRCIQKHGFTISAEVLDSIKAQGYKFSTRSGMTISIADMVVPEAKKGKDRRDREKGPRDRKAVQARSYHQRRTLPHGRRRVGKNDRRSR